MKFAGAYVPIEKPDKPRVRAVFDRHNGGPSDEYAEVFTAAEVRRPVNVGDPAQVYVASKPASPVPVIVTYCSRPPSPPSNCEKTPVTLPTWRSM